jgi:2-polyprenyl-3-methyl-5-hydroxy-6-metoxy-1,4-benzoquinol methylase
MTEGHLVAPTHGGTYWRCHGCHLETRMPEGEETREEMFRASQEQCYTDEDGVLTPAPMRRIHREFALRRWAILRSMMPGGTLLEIGPGSGEFLQIAKAAGVNVEAVEHSAKLAEVLRREHGIPVACGMFEDLDMAGRVYDAAASFHVIEHTLAPWDHLRKVREIVRDGGLLFIATPNLGSWNRRIAGRRWPGYSASHLYLFDVKSLRRTLERAGWNVRSVYTIEHAVHLASTLTYLRRRPRGVRSLRQAGKLVQSTPAAPIRILMAALGVLSWPMRKVQEAAKSGSELLLVAEAVSSSPTCENSNPGRPGASVLR